MHITNKTNHHLKEVNFFKVKSGSEAYFKCTNEPYGPTLQMITVPKLASAVISHTVYIALIIIKKIKLIQKKEENRHVISSIGNTRGCANYSSRKK